jgi:hypothetical protein
MNIELGCLYFVEYYHYKPDICIVVKKRTPFKRRRIRQFLAIASENSFRALETVMRPSSIYIKNIRKIEPKDLPLYISWRHSPKFEEILSG